VKDKYQLIVNGTDVTAITDALAWQSDLESLGMSLNFSVAAPYFDKFRKYPVFNEGHKVALKNNGELRFVGKVIDTELNKTQRSILAMDYAYFMNRSEHVLQFKKTAVDAAIKSACGKFGIPLGKVCTMSTIVSKLYKGETLADVFRDLIDLHRKATGQRIRMEMIQGKLEFIKCAEEVIDPYYLIGEGMKPVKVTEFIGDDFTLKSSIAEIVNSVVVLSNQGKTLATAKDSASVKYFGLIQDIIEVGKDEAKTAQAIANAGLVSDVKELSLTLLGDDTMIAGRTIKLSGIFAGNWLITSASHTVANGIHKCSVNIRR
jgi:hypothetical protein